MRPRGRQGVRDLSNLENTAGSLEVLRAFPSCEHLRKLGQEVFSVFGMGGLKLHIRA
jgi:hypothetical protein